MKYFPRRGFRIYSGRHESAAYCDNHNMLHSLDLEEIMTFNVPLRFAGLSFLGFLGFPGDCSGTLEISLSLFELSYQYEISLIRCENTSQLLVNIQTFVG